MKWIKVHDQDNGGYIIHEVKCPVCNTKETYINDKIPSFCYLCQERMVDDEEA